MENCDQFVLIIDATNEVQRVTKQKQSRTHVVPLR